MFKRITHTFIHVLDQDEALDFYVGKLGMVVHTDADLSFMRWLTVTLPEQPDLQVGLMLPGPPAFDDSTAEEIRQLVTKGAAGGGVIFETDENSQVIAKYLEDIYAELADRATAFISICCRILCEYLKDFVSRNTSSGQIS